MKESEIQSTCIKFLRINGYKVIRLMNSGERGTPDILVIGNNDMFFIEFKTLKGKLSQIQKYQINDLQERGFRTYIIRDIDELKQLIYAR